MRAKAWLPWKEAQLRSGEPLHSPTWLQREARSLGGECGWGGEGVWAGRCWASSQQPRSVQRPLGSSLVWLPVCLTFSPNLISGPLDSTLQPLWPPGCSEPLGSLSLVCFACLKCCSHHLLPLPRTQCKCHLLWDAFPASLTK